MALKKIQYPELQLEIVKIEKPIEKPIFEYIEVKIKKEKKYIN